MPSNTYQPDHGDLHQFHTVAFPGPLMSNKMQKEDLLKFIECQVEECLSRIKELHQMEAYFFWQIMDLFCRQNGEVMMAQVTTILFKGDGLIKKKLRGTEDLKYWFLSLAQLLCSSAPDDERREAVIQMGDDLAFKGLTFAAHICYVVAKVELGTRSRFELIGCDKYFVPFGLTVLTSAIERTEVYEYVLSLTSGLAQPNFQIFKLCHANRFAQAEFPKEAMQYCETIARAVITFPGRIKRSFVKRLVLLFNMLQEGAEGQEPVWLLELCQLYKIKATDADANSDSEQYSTSTGSEMEYNLQTSENSSTSHKIIAPQSPDVERTDPEIVFASRYTTGELLRMGSFGSVYAGIRVEDGKEVAIKTVGKNIVTNILIDPRERRELPLEVALMEMVSKPPRCSNVVELLDYFEMPDRIVMVLERPSPCMTLRDFARLQDGCLTEAQTRDIMQQVVQAARHCCDRKVLHRDIKAENLLINTDTMQVKIIDFVYGDLLKDTPYRKYAGTRAFCPPEWLMLGMYEGIPATIWGLGILMYNLVCGNYPFRSDRDFEGGRLDLCPGVSRDFFDLMMWCLEFEPTLRPSFEDITRHEWFTEGVQILSGTNDVATA
ncbi:serine/threonine-protein kinase par-1-like isoform X2 [Ictalurus furcatus]|uniref:serine/threonine-protein kinase par-1-like isoform X2 n=1 Tax=Ictalurus furcatus TaxID=66913 RepID=UPI002350DFA8|nr:serine/threonine-protein kinase par-1-like isoform X2 [Ictalurus furcatus]